MIWIIWKDPLKRQFGPFKSRKQVKKLAKLQSKRIRRQETADNWTDASDPPCNFARQ